MHLRGKRVAQREGAYQSTVSAEYYTVALSISTSSISPSQFHQPTCFQVRRATCLHKTFQKIAKMPYFFLIFLLILLIIIRKGGGRYHRYHHFLSIKSHIVQLQLYKVQSIGDGHWIYYTDHLRHVILQGSRSFNSWDLRSKDRTKHVILKVGFAGNKNLQNILKFYERKRLFEDAKTI